MLQQGASTSLGSTLSSTIPSHLPSRIMCTELAGLEEQGRTAHHTPFSRFEAFPCDFQHFRLFSNCISVYYTPAFLDLWQIEGWRVGKSVEGFKPGGEDKSYGSCSTTFISHFCQVPAAMNDFDLCIKKKEHKLYGAFGPKEHLGPMKKATKITFD